MKASYILFLALLGVSALSLARCDADANTFGRADSRPAVVIRTNDSGIVTIDAVNAALNRTWGNIRRNFGRTNRTNRFPTPAPLASFLTVDAGRLATLKGINATIINGGSAFQVTLTRRPIFHAMVSYLASTTNNTNVTGFVIVTLPKTAWAQAAALEDADDVSAANFNRNATRPPRQPQIFSSMVSKTLAANETTTTVTVADINGVRGNFTFPKIATFTIRPDLASISSAATSRFSWGSVSFDAAVSTTSFNVTLPISVRKTNTWVVVAVTGTTRTNVTTQGTVSVKINRPRN